MHTLILGFDSFDPTTFERLASQGKMPNLAKYAEGGKFARLRVSDPPQTEVSWTSIATGEDPGGHGIFDFVHRDPATYTPYVSLLPTQHNALGVQFSSPIRARTLFEEATRLGYPATSLWWPATFPARLESPVRTIPGLGTPDILGKLGGGCLYTTQEDLADLDQKTAVKILKKVGQDRYGSTVDGPMSKRHSAVQSTTADLRLELIDDRSAVLTIGNQTMQLSLGRWSAILEIPFKMGLLVTIRALTRVILTQVCPYVRLYLLPLQIHPLASPWRYATPPSFVKQIWKSSGPYLTLGWPQDTTGLEEDCISDDQFLDLCTSIFAGRERTLMHLLESFREGLLGIIFDDLDRIQHMFRRDRPEIVEEWYTRLDGLVGRVAQKLPLQGNKAARLLVLSDHGFSEFTYKVHLNRWLIGQGFLADRNGDESGSLRDVDWSRSQAYAIGLNSLYVNLEKREGKGCVPVDQYAALLQDVRQRLTDWLGPDGRPVVQRVLLRDEAFSGPLTGYGPDFVIGFSPGYRASSDTGLGKWQAVEVEPNGDHWGSDHCIDSTSVPGVIFSNKSLEGLSSLSFRDIPSLAIGKAIEQSYTQPPPSSISDEEDQEIIEERLKGLGYL